jgi:hypothetical protein
VVSAARRLAVAAALLVALGLAGCEFDEKTIGVSERQIVVHAVLDPLPATQVVLVEELLTGRVRVNEQTPDSADLIVSGGGVPISGARVVVTASSGDSAVAVEDVVSRGDGKGAGVYRFRNAQKTMGQPDFLLVSPGERYTLRVETPGGSVVTGSTLVPNTIPTSLNLSARPFNRDRDSLFLQWSAVQQAHRYAIRVDAPRGPLVVFVDSLEYLVSGTLRNFFSEGLPAAFVPGFRQTITVGAVDENFYDYFRSQNNPLTGSGLIDHLQGGRGLFGSYVMMRGQTVNVIADTDEAIEAGYRRFAGPAATSPSSFNIYIESEGSSTTRQVSGNWTATFAGGSRGLIGTFDTQSRLTIALLRGQFATDTVDVLELTWDGLALLGRLRSTGERVDYRRATLP